MCRLLLALAVFLAAASAPAEQTLRLPVIGATIQMPAGATWKAKVIAGDNGWSFDRLDRTSPASPELVLTLRRDTLTKSCSKFFQKASKDKEEGAKITDGDGLVPASWDPRVVTAEGVVFFCMNTSPGIIVAVTGVEDISDETKPSIRALLESVAEGFKK